MNNFSQILNISNEECIKFIFKRFQLKKYRGLQLFQHNRYDSNKFYSILNEIKKIFLELNCLFIEIPKGDENNGKNNGFYLCDYPEYKKIVDNIKTVGCGGTANTLKKNYFPDWESFGLIQRKKDNKKLFFKISDYILNTNTNKWKEDELYKKFVSHKVEAYIEPIYSIIKEFNYIDINEFLLFFSFIDNIDIINNNVNTREEKLDFVKGLITSWRRLTKIQKESCLSILKKYMDPKKHKNVTKDLKKDWGNFKNESTEIISKLKNANLFVIDNDLTIKLNVSNKNNVKFVRDKKIYEEYHKFNNTKKTPGYQMDHIVKFTLATTYDELSYIDHYLNLLYIDGKSHSIKNTYGSNHMILSYDEEKLILKNPNIDIIDIELFIDNNVLISKSNIEKYIDHNKILLKKL